MAQILELPQELLDRIAELSEGQCRAVNRNLHNLSKTYYYRHVCLRGTHGRVYPIINPPPLGRLSSFLRLIIEDASIRREVESIQVSWDCHSYGPSEERETKWSRDRLNDVLGSLATTARQYDSVLATHILTGECSAQVVLLLLHLLPNLRSLNVVGAVDADCVWFSLQDFIPQNVLKLLSRIPPPSSLFSLKKFSIEIHYEPYGEEGLQLDPLLALPWFFLPALSILKFTALVNTDRSPVFVPQIISLYGTSQVTELDFFMCQTDMEYLEHLLQLPARLQKLSYSCCELGESDRPFLTKGFGKALRKLRSPESLTHLTLDTNCIFETLEAGRSEMGVGDLTSFTSLRFLQINIGALLVITNDGYPQLVGLLPPSIEELHIQLGAPYCWTEDNSDIPHQILPVIERQSSSLRKLSVSGVTTNRLGEVRDVCLSRGVSLVLRDFLGRKDVTAETRPFYTNS